MGKKKKKIKKRRIPKVGDIIRSTAPDTKDLGVGIIVNLQMTVFFHEQFTDIIFAPSLKELESTVRTIVRKIQKSEKLSIETLVARQAIPVYLKSLRYQSISRPEWLQPLTSSEIMLDRFSDLSR